MTPAIDAVDVLVWGGGTGGIAAAIQAARGGATTLLLTPGAWLGGMVSAAGVCCPDGNELTPWQTGLWGAFLRELERREPEGLDHNWVSCFGYRPTTAEAILQDWVHAEPKLLWWPGCRLVAVERLGSLIAAVRLEIEGEQRRVRCRVVIDGSDRGDLLPLAEAPFRLGWEPQEQWDEPSAPSQHRLDSEAFFREQPVQSPTWVVMGQLQSDRLAADPVRGIDPALTTPLPAPFERACEAFGLERTLTYGRLPGGLVMLNWPLHGNDWHWGLERAFAGDPSQEAALYGEMQAHSLRFAEVLQEASGGWLQLGEAFPKEAGSPAPWLAAMPYWREGRRLIGRQTVIEQDLLPQASGASVAALPLDDAGELQSIAVGNYANDHHYPGPDWPLAPKSCRWGGRWSGTPFCIPYGALVSEAFDNLLAADKAFSTSHMANGATRLQPLILNVGQAAGAAAALAVRVGVPPAQLAVRDLQNVLIADPLAPSAVAPLWDTPWHHPQWRERQEAVLANPQPFEQGHAAAGSAAQASIPIDRHEQLWSGRVKATSNGDYSFTSSSGEVWPVITLEPSMHEWLSQQSESRPVALIGHANPWGPWLRISRLAV
ncbi:FAD-dependent oxidoreductase [Vulcanococcus sp. Clear-D1]|uniref:FAD-dependent oxidoreductase n=1 Tax=Vulcanococcus sp. Clear-D1 TaxID=2766970 RepID=UPI0019A02FB6|nr:FAD-dependent oxidoreductase [Vulcanococcus sp. Clear-D1]MBD1193626.1 FAD-dependent oxidoreductase [Vulcanococcus sp. Clear-D1]